MKINKLENKKTNYYRHGFHPYPAKFTPQIVNKYLNLFCKSSYRILDPFCGSGTTLLEGIINGLESYGIDLNPIAALISRAKTHNYTNDQINSIIEFKNKLTQNSLEFNFSDWINEETKNLVIPEFPNRQHWFQENVSVELAILKKLISEIEDVNVRDLLFCAFSKIIVKVSNQDSEVRYSSKNKNHENGVVVFSFLATLTSYLNELTSKNFSILAEAKVYNDDSIKILKEMENNYFDFVITSPPYINTFDYYLYHKQRMFWLGFDHKPIRNKEIGNHHKIDTKTFDVAKSEYIISMTNIMNELSRVSKRNSYFVMIIGDGIVEGTTIDMREVIKEICTLSNYDIESVESVNLSDITKSFNKKFSNAPKKEHSITLRNNK